MAQPPRGRSGPGCCRAVHGRQPRRHALAHALLQGARERSHMTVTTGPRVSVAIPLHNEAPVLAELLRRVGSVLDALPGGPHEIVVVDDGSTDGTMAALEAAVAREPRLVAVSLSRNFGHQAALTAALDQVTGDATVLMDGDLQDQPEAIPQFLERFSQG